MTRIWPGYDSSVSTFLAMSRASIVAASSLIFMLSTMMRTSRPAWMAYDFSTPANDFAIRSRSSSRLR